jgi:MFS superfamily sulfate permease-like transporter
MLAAIAIPEQMATARLGHFAPETGFVVFVAATVAFVAVGASRTMSVGADSTITPIFAAGVILLAPPGTQGYAVLAAALALLVGAFLLAAGALRLGWIANLLSVPVTTGFLAGIAIHIAVSQLPTALGLTPAQGSLFDQIGHLLAGIDETKLAPLAVAAAVLSITLVSEKLNPRIPGAFAGLLLAAIAAIVLERRHIAIETLGALAPPQISLNVTPPTFADILHLTPLALILTLVIMVQSAVTSRSLPSAEETGSDFNRDLMGVGAANILAAAFNAFPVNASPPRSAVAADTGAKTQFCGLTAAGIVALLATFGSPLLSNIPSAALAGVLLFVSCRIMRVRTMHAVLRQSRGEFALIAATVLAIIVLPIEVGVGIGIVLSLLHGMWIATRTRLIELMNVPGTTVWWPPEEENSGRSLPGVNVVAFQAPLSFLNADELRSGFSELLTNGAAKLIVLEASGIAEIDYTAAQAFKDVIRQCHEKKVTFAVARLESVRARDALERFGVLDILGSGFVYRSVDDAIRSLDPPAARANPGNDASRA